MVHLYRTQRESKVKSVEFGQGVPSLVFSARFFSTAIKRALIFFVGKNYILSEGSRLDIFRKHYVPIYPCPIILGGQLLPVLEISSAEKRIARTPVCNLNNAIYG